MAGGLVGGDQAAEADVVARGVLDPGQDALDAEPDEHVAAELDAVETDRDVVGEQRDVDSGGDGAEVGLDLLGVVERVEGARGDDGVHAQAPGPAGLGDDAVRRGVDRPGQDRHAARRRGDGALDDGVALGVGEVGRLAGGAQDEQPVDPSCDQVLDNAVEAIEIDGAVLGERGDERRNDAGETSIHMRFSFRLP